MIYKLLLLAIISISGLALTLTYAESNPCDYTLAYTIEFKNTTSNYPIVSLTGCHDGTGGNIIGYLSDPENKILKWYDITTEYQMYNFTTQVDDTWINGKYYLTLEDGNTMLQTKGMLYSGTPTPTLEPEPTPELPILTPVDQSVIDELEPDTSMITPPELLVKIQNHGYYFSSEEGSNYLVYKFTTISKINGEIDLSITDDTNTIYEESLNSKKGTNIYKVFVSLTDVEMPAELTATLSYDGKTFHTESITYN